jgi:O-antigen/teichoic acid export membrane protein
VRAGVLGRGLAAAGSLFGRRSFDMATAAGRSSERYRRVALSSLASAGTRAVSVVITFALVPILMRYLGAERYGLFMTITSVLMMLTFTDLGVGNGLLNAISEAHGADDRRSMQISVSSAFTVLSGLALLLFVAFTFAAPVIPWGLAFNINSPGGVVEAAPAMWVLVGCLLLSMPLAIVQRVQVGHQESFRTQAWLGVGSLLGFVGVIAAVRFKASLPWLVLATAGGPVVATLLNFVNEFAWRRPWLRPRHRFSRRDAARALLGTGLLFLIIQVAVAFTYASDNFIVAQLLGARAVTEYSIAARLFSVSPLMLGFVLGPLWPAYGEAQVRRDNGWIVRTFRRSLVLSMAVSLSLALATLVFQRQIFAAWVGPDLRPSWALLVGLAVWSVISSVAAALAMVLNGMGVIRLQAIAAILMLVVATVVKVALVRRVGLPGIIWGTIIGHLVCVAAPLFWAVTTLLAKLKPTTP